MATRQSGALALISINSVIEEAMRFLQHEMQAQDVRLTLDLARNLRGVNADRIQIQQVIVNLTVNAIQAMTESATDSRHLRVATKMEDSRHVIVRVEDSGPGIPEEIKPHLFERFYSTKPGGMGMGLPICQSIVEAHGGRIDVVSHPGTGARFSFTLPVAAH
jgi:signal transduction histidine kinase